MEIEDHAILPTSSQAGQSYFHWGGTLSAVADWPDFLDEAFVQQGLHVELLESRTCFYCVEIAKPKRFLLILNRMGRRSHLQTSLLVAYIFSSLPTVLFNILRGQFGLWVAFLAVASHLFFPETFPVSRVVLFVVTPSWVAHALRDSIAGCISCLVIGAFLLLEQIRGTGGFRNCCEDCHWVSYVAIISLLLLFPVLYLRMGSY